MCYIYITRPQKHFAFKFLSCLNKGCDDDDDDGISSQLKKYHTKKKKAITVKITSNQIFISQTILQRPT